MSYMYVQNVTAYYSRDLSTCPLCFQVIDEMVFAIGGFNGVTTIFNVECFDASTDEWSV